MWLRDSALTLEDYSLWKTHELEDVDPTTTCPWPGSGQLLEEALFLVPENMPAGRVNGQRLATRSPLHSEPGAASSTGVVVRCEARHNKPGNYAALPITAEESALYKAELKYTEGQLEMQKRSSRSNSPLGS